MKILCIMILCGIYSIEASTCLEKTKIFFARNVELDKESVADLLSESVIQYYYRVQNDRTEDPVKMNGKKQVLECLDKGLFSRAKAVSVLSVDYEAIEDHGTFTCQTCIDYHDGSRSFFQDTTQLYFDSEGLIYQIIKNVKKS